MVPFVQILNPFCTQPGVLLPSLRRLSDRKLSKRLWIYVITDDFSYLTVEKKFNSPAAGKTLFHGSVWPESTLKQSHEWIRRESRARHAHIAHALVILWTATLRASRANSLPIRIYDDEVNFFGFHACLHFRKIRNKQRKFGSPYSKILAANSVKSFSFVYSSVRNMKLKRRVACLFWSSRPIHIRN